MASMNKVMLMGNLTRPPEVKTLPSGNSVCEFGLAINRKFTTRDGDEREEVTYVELSCCGRGGEVIKQIAIRVARYLSRVACVMIPGRTIKVKSAIASRL